MTTDARKTYAAGLFDRAAPTYDQIGVEFVGAAGSALVAAVDVRAGDHVLDVGCGRGACLVPAAAAVGPRGSAIGIDLSGVWWPRPPPNSTGAGSAMQASGSATPRRRTFPAASFDVILAGLVVFFLPDPLAGAKAYARLLRPGGRLARSTFQEHAEKQRAVRQRVFDTLAPYLRP